MHVSLSTPSALPASRLFSSGDVPAAGQPRSTAAVQADGLALDSSILLRGHKAVIIVHNGASYRLQATKLGKLILTK